MGYKNCIEYIEEDYRVYASGVSININNKVKKYTQNLMI